MSDSLTLTKISIRKTLHGWHIGKAMRHNFNCNKICASCFIYAAAQQARTNVLILLKPRKILCLNFTSTCTCTCTRGFKSNLFENL